jgi:hypothetical protein
MIRNLRTEIIADLAEKESLRRHLEQISFGVTIDQDGYVFAVPD